MRFPPDIQSIRRARRIIHDMLAEAAGAGPARDDGHAPDFVDDVVLLVSELCENAVLHAGTAFDLAVSADDDEVTVAVTDRGTGALELHLAEPPALRSGSHPRSRPVLIARLATTWGTRHEADGHHTVWFTLVRKPGPAAEPATTPAPEHERTWSATEEARWLLHVPASLARRLDPVDLVRELAARLRDMADAAAVVVEVDRGDGRGPRVRARRCCPGRQSRRAWKRSRRAAADHDRPARHHPARPARGADAARRRAGRADRRAGRHHRRVPVAPRGGPAPPGGRPIWPRPASSSASPSTST